MSHNRPMLKGKTDYVKAVQIAAANSLLFHLAASNSSASVVWVQVWDVAAAADIGSVETVPDYEVAVAPNGGILAIPFHREGWQLGHGIYVRAVSSSGGTIVSTNCVKFTYQYDTPWPVA